MDIVYSIFPNLRGLWEHLTVEDGSIFLTVSSTYFVTAIVSFGFSILRDMMKQVISLRRYNTYFRGKEGFRMGTVVLAELNSGDIIDTAMTFVNAGMPILCVVGGLKLGMRFFRGFFH